MKFYNLLLGKGFSSLSINNRTNFFSEKKYNEAFQGVCLEYLQSVTRAGRLRECKKYRVCLGGKKNGFSPPCKGIQIPKPGKFVLVESGILGFGIQNKAQGFH